MLHIENLSVYYEQKMALDSIQMQCEPGKIYGLIGANGAGKSTLLKVLSGIVSAYEGTVRWQDQPLRRAQWQDPRFCSYAPEDVELMPWLKVHEFLELIATIRKEKNSAQISHSFSELLNLQEKENELITELSHGMRQKLAIAAALIGHPQLQLYDETFNGLDTPTMQQLTTHLQREKEAGACIFIASHVLPLVKSWCDRVFYLKEGRIITRLEDRELENWPADDFPKA